MVLMRKFVWQLHARFTKSMELYFYLSYRCHVPLVEFIFKHTNKGGPNANSWPDYIILWAYFYSVINF